MSVATTGSMPGSMLGMDTQQVTDLGTTLVRDAAEVEQVVAAVRSLVAGLAGTWLGADSERFRAEWAQVHGPALAAIAVALREHGQAVLAQAQQQERASAATGAAPGGSGTGTGQPGAATRAPGAPVAPDRDLLSLADGVYTDSGDVTTPNGTYHRLTGDELRKIGVDPATLITPDSGFAAAVYRTPEGRYVLAFRGTDGWIGPDGVTNVAGALGPVVTGQTVQAVDLARRVQAGVGAGDLEIVGHSLGGRLASAASIATGAPAVTFNAAGLSDAEMAYALHAAGRPDHVAGVVAKYGVLSSMPAPVALWLSERIDPFSAERAQLAGGQIRSFNVTGEVLSKLQDNTMAPNALGSRTALPRLPGVSMGDEHGMDSVIRAWNLAHPGDTPAVRGR